MIKINGLTPDQVVMLDIIWSFDTQEDLLNFLETLDEREQCEYHTLSQLVIMEVLDKHINKMADFPEARKVLLEVM